MTIFRSALVAFSLLVPSQAFAASADASADSSPEHGERASVFHIDVETDPTAFILSGYSLHVGLGYRRFRLDLGGYAMDIPGFVHGNDAFDVSFDGLGAKLQMFLFDEQEGAFVGVDSGLMRLEVERRDMNASAAQTQVGVGAHVGWRIGLPAGFHATPWLGVGYVFGASDVVLGGETFEAAPVTVFPAIHLGHRFQ